MVNKTSTSHLSISNGDMLMSHSLQSPNLLLNKQLHLSPETSPEAYSPEIAVQDEVTVMNNRLAHLQKQISTLQQRNAALEAANNPKAQPIEQDKTSSNNWQWLSYLADASLLAGTYFAADWWRRRRQTRQLDLAEADWINFEHGETAPKGTVRSMPADQNILDHADVFLSHGCTSLAIQLLQNHLLDYPKQSVTIWLFLLDLQAKENMQAAYEQTALECKKHFNIRIAEFSNDEASEKITLEDFSRLHTALKEIWGAPAAVVFLDDLIYNSRPESRAGFEKSVVEELLLLKNIANEFITTAEVIQIHEKKLVMKERKEEQLAAKNVEKLQQTNALVLVEQSKLTAIDATNKSNDDFEFN